VIRYKDLTPVGWVLVGLFVIGIVNFVVSMLIYHKLGGDAFGGYVKDGHYFVGDHGRYTETTKTVWAYCRYHTMSVIGTHAVAIASAVLLACRVGQRWKT
jgi:hypothetical protein